jgi:hypothetical protein
MEAWYLPAALVLLALACVVAGLFSAESRPGFAEALSNYRERWFPHSRKD